jgi:hypothetical protein
MWWETSRQGAGVCPHDACCREYCLMQRVAPLRAQPPKFLPSSFRVLLLSRTTSISDVFGYLLRGARPFGEDCPAGLEEPCADRTWLTQLLSRRCRCCCTRRCCRMAQINPAMWSRRRYAGCSIMLASWEGVRCVVTDFILCRLRSELLLLQLHLRPCKRSTLWKS